MKAYRLVPGRLYVTILNGTRQTLRFKMRLKFESGAIRYEFEICESEVSGRFGRDAIKDMIPAGPLDVLKYGGRT